MKYTKGDLLQATERLIAHGCNAQGVMGSGVALAIDKAFPEATKPYFDAASKVHPLPVGATFTGHDKASNRVVFNAVTQFTMGPPPERYTSYDGLDKAMRIAARIAKLINEPNIAIPRIGAVRGGGDWNVIVAILDRITHDTGVEFNCYIPENEWAGAGLS